GAGDWLLFTAGGKAPPDPVLAQVSSTAEVIWNALAADEAHATPIPDKGALPIPHTVLTLTGDTALASDWTDAKGVSIAFDWVSVGTLLDQPFGPWSGKPVKLIGTGPQPFPAWSGQDILLQDSTGIGIPAAGSSANDDNLKVGGLPDPVPVLQPPFLVLPNLLPVTRGKTLANEVLGSGNATNPAQDFKLSQSPVTYLQNGTTYGSTIDLTVNGLPWQEVPSFYGQAPDATVFVTREDNSGSTHLMFGDGVNGARLPTGINNVVATYRVGAGADSPPAGKLTVIAKPYPGLRSVLNPVAVIGGADADPPDQIRHYAPRSVLTFGRAVSVFDYQALAAQVPGVTRAGAVWGWDDARQRALVTVYVGDDPGAQKAARKVLLAAGDPNRPVQVVQATQVAVALVVTLIVTPGMDTTTIGAAVATALTDMEVGLFGSWNMGIGQVVFASQIEAAVLGVQGAVAITKLSFFANDATKAGPIYDPGEGGYFTLDPRDINLTPEPDPNG
ncbi:MAG TPA: baseplate J/gp47 family protein, partial [Stellaceae bacterium]|nr:baseplate J/gp47 family protein [Stellaceae bacterium]